MTTRQAYHRNYQKKDKLTTKRYSIYFTKKKPVVKLDEVFASHGKAVVTSLDLAFGVNLRHKALMSYIESLDLGKNTQRSLYFEPVILNTPGSESFRGYYITKRGFDVLGDEIFVNEAQKKEYTDAFDIVDNNIKTHRRSVQYAKRKINNILKEESTIAVQAD